MKAQLVVVNAKGREITPRQREWLEAYLACGNAAEASRRIGITNHPASYGQQLRETLSYVIQKNLQKMIGAKAPAALEIVYEIATTCTDPKIRLAAAQDLLNRAGYKEVRKVEISTKDKSDEELNKEIHHLLQKGGIIDAEVVDREGL